VAAQVEQLTRREEHREHSSTTVACDAFPTDVLHQLVAWFGTNHWCISGEELEL
jgi:hypothetical protein